MKRNSASGPYALLIGLLFALAPQSAAGGAPASAPVDAPDAFPVTLGAFATTLIGSLPARTQNIRRAAQALDGTELAPGEGLSFDRQVGARTLDRGYLPAPVILRETRQMQTGGGVCQVASTLFAAALVAGLSPVERWRHSTPVDYIALGEDATIAWGVKDLRIRNDLGQRVRLRVEVLGSTLSVRIEGEAELADRFELETVEVEATPGAADGGREIELYRLRTRDGETIERELVHRDQYPPSLGPAPREGVR
jgi:vancomycin resistance protein YoaR